MRPHVTNTSQKLVFVRAEDKVVTLRPHVVFARADDGHPPISWPVAQSVFDQHPNFGHIARIIGIMQFE